MLSHARGGRAIEKKDQCDGDMCVVLLLCGFFATSDDDNCDNKNPFSQFLLCSVEEEGDVYGIEATARLNFSAVSRSCCC